MGTSFRFTPGRLLWVLYYVDQGFTPGELPGVLSALAQGCTLEGLPGVLPSDAQGWSFLTPRCAQLEVS